MFSYEDIILTVNDKKIDIMNTDLKSTLIMYITTYYDYTIEKERDSLNIKVRDNILYFKHSKYFVSSTLSFNISYTLLGTLSCIFCLFKSLVLIFEADIILESESKS